jgi:serine/threonine protein phosphatase PrpC
MKTKMADDSSVDGSLVLSVAQFTHAGGRRANQDALASAQQDDLACFVMSDGAGGHHGGEIASAIVVDAVIGRFLQDAAFGPRALRSYIDCASARVARRKSEDQRLQAMSATVAAVLIDRKNRSALWAHLGDTRVYLFRRNKLYQLTRDHSVVQELIDAGYCRADQLRTHPQRNALRAAVGAEGGSMPEVTQAATAIEAGDSFLICTDGFWEWITEQEMEHAAASAHSAQQWLMTMRVIVEKNGRLGNASHDNYTAFAIYFDDAEHGVSGSGHRATIS